MAYTEDQLDIARDDLMFCLDLAQKRLNEVEAKA
jgi:hypothetical protein